MWWLVVSTSDNPGRPVNALALSQEKTILGKGEDCDLVLFGTRVSRRHCEIRRIDKGYILQDLKSSLGTYVNDERAKETFLSLGDVIKIDDIVLEVCDKPKPKVAKKRPQKISAKQKTDVVANTAQTNWRPFSSFVDGLRSSSKPQEVLERLLDGLTEFVGAERGFVLLESQRNTLVRVAARGLVDGEECEAISKTVCASALQEKELLAIADSLSDTRCHGAPSLAVSTMPRAILCAPLMAHEKPVGVIYLDRPRGDTPWTEEQQPFFRVVTSLAAELVAAQQTRKLLLDANSTIAALRRLDSDSATFVAGDGKAAKELQGHIDAAAAQDITVLITGETGTGKEMVARELHLRSSRSAGPFVAVNCAALPRDIIEAELFGAEKGAYTGATEKRLGRFELASGGTLFLDEIGELPLDVQVTLLRVLQERSIRRLGGQDDIPLDIRLVCATNADLERQVQEGSFRQDFYYRVNVFRLRLRPLRERTEDVLPLAEHFLHTFALRFGRKLKGFDKKAQKALKTYAWPGNIRELRNAIERAVVIEQEGKISAESLPIGSLGPSSLSSPSGSQLPIEDLPEDYELARESFDKLFLERALRRAEGKLRAVARNTGMSRTTLYKKLEKLGMMKGE